MIHRSLLTMPEWKLREKLDYDSLTGIFRWRVGTNIHIEAGDIAGRVGPGGYVRIWIDWKKYQAHRLAYAYQYGFFPVGDIDHENGNTGDNRISNLSAVTFRENSQNLRRHREGKLVGAHFYKRTAQWQSNIKINGRMEYLGLFNSEQEAHEAYVAREKTLVSVSP